jgi:hypothetical protein
MVINKYKIDIRCACSRRDRHDDPIKREHNRELQLEQTVTLLLRD